MQTSHNCIRQTKNATYRKTVASKTQGKVFPRLFISHKYLGFFNSHLPIHLGKYGLVGVLGVVFECCLKLEVSLVFGHVGHIF